MSLAATLATLADELARAEPDAEARAAQLGMDGSTARAFVLGAVAMRASIVAARLRLLSREADNQINCEGDE